MKAETLQHAYYAGRLATCLPKGGHSAILDSVSQTPSKSPAIKKVHPEEVLPEELPAPEFSLRIDAHTLQTSTFLLKIAEEFPCFKGSQLVTDLPANEASQRLTVAAYVAGFLSPRFPYEVSLELNTLTAVLKAGISHKQETDLAVSYRDTNSEAFHKPTDT
ncbi:hypothetical protein ARSEF4850_001421 [Beauveria asiatica]